MDFINLIIELHGDNIYVSRFYSIIPSSLLIAIASVSVNGASSIRGLKTTLSGAPTNLQKKWNIFIGFDSSQWGGTEHFHPVGKFRTEVNFFQDKGEKNLGVWSQIPLVC